MDINLLPICLSHLNPRKSRLFRLSLGMSELLF